MQLIFDFPSTPCYTFENFVVCDGNKAACHFARKLAGNDGTENLLYVYGPPGGGKTHLLAAVANCLSSSAAPAPMISCREIGQLYGGDYSAERVSLLGEQFRDAQALLLDDIHLLPDNANLKVEIWQLFNDFYDSGRRIMITGLAPPKELAGLDDHLISRLLWGLVARVDINDDESRRMILAKLAEDMQVIVPSDVAEYVLKHVRRDVPSLRGALEEIGRYALSEGRKVTLRLAREALGRMQ